MKYDTVIIGAGLGGLTAGAKLAKEGRTVLLIEQHKIVGGCATTFKRKNYKIDVGFHKLDGLDKDDIKTKIFKEFNILDNIELIKIPEFYRFLNQRVDIVIPYDYKEATKILIDKFPDEKKGILKFFKVILKIRKEVSRIPRKIWHMAFMLPVIPFIYKNILTYLNKTVGNFLDSIIKNEDLKLILLATIKYYHDDPYTLSLIFYSCAHGSFFSGGAYYIRGGAQNLSDYLARIIKENKGDILINHTVTKILTENDKVTGVVYKRNNFNSEKIVYANNIIANVSVPNTIGTLLQTKNLHKFKNHVKELKAACSLFSIYFFFKKSVKELMNDNYSTFVFHEDIWKISDLLGNHNNDNYEKRNFVFVDYSQIDSGLTTEGKSVGVLNTIDYYDNWKDLNKKEYNKKKEKIAKIFIERLDKIIPGIKKHIDFYETATPMTIYRYTLNPEGTPYGFAQIPDQAGLNRISHRSPINNLYFASAWTMPGGGFTGAIISGYYSALGILDKKAKSIS